MEMTMFGEEVQRADGERILQIVQEQPSKHPRQHPDRQEEPRPAGDPALPVRRNAAAGNQKMDVRVYAVRTVMPSQPEAEQIRR
jgi:hypothetical protein